MQCVYGHVFMTVVCLFLCLLDRGEQHKSTLSPCFGHPATGAVRVRALACSRVSCWWCIEGELGWWCIEGELGWWWCIEGELGWWCIEGELIVPCAHGTCRHTQRNKHAWTHAQTNTQSQCTHHMLHMHLYQILCTCSIYLLYPPSFASLTDLVDHLVRY